MLDDRFEHCILGTLIDSSINYKVKISELIGLRTADTNKIHTINYTNIKTSFPLAAFVNNNNHYIITYIDEEIPRTHISLRNNSLILSPGLSSEIVLDINRVNSRYSLASLHSKLVVDSLLNDGFQRARTLGGRDKSKLISKELIDSLNLKHKYTNYETDGVETKEVNYSLYKAIKKSVQILPSGQILVALNPSTIIQRDGYVPYTYYQLPDRVIKKFNSHWRMSGQKVLIESEYPLKLINSKFSQKDHPTIESGLVHLPNQMTILSPPKFIFGNNKKIELDSKTKVRDLIKTGLNSYGPIYKPRELKILVATDTQDMLNERDPPKYFNLWSTAFKEYIKIIKSLLIKGENSLFHINSVNFIGPVYLRGTAPDYLNMLSDLAKKESVDAVLYIIAEYKDDKTGMHDLIKEYLKDIPTKCILTKNLKKHTPKSKFGYSPMFLQIVDDLVISLYFAATGYFPWSVDSKHFDSVVGIDVRRDKQARYYCITLTTLTEKGLIRVSNGDKMSTGENIPIEALTDSIEKLIAKVKKRELSFTNTLFVRDGFDFKNEKEAVKDKLDKLKLEGLLDEDHKWVYCQIIKNPEIRIIHEPTLNDPSRLGQPSRGAAFILADLLDWKEGYIVSTGYPDIGMKNKSKASDQGLSQPIFIREIERSTNNKTSFKQVLETIYHRTFINPSMKQIRVPIEIPAAEKYMEYLSYGLQSEEIPEFLGGG